MSNDTENKLVRFHLQGETMKTFIQATVVGVALAAHPVEAVLLCVAIVLVHIARRYLHNKAEAVAAAEEAMEAAEAAEKEAINVYHEVVEVALKRMRKGMKPAYAVGAGMLAIQRGDEETLKRLVDAAHDDTGLIQALERRSGKKLAYLAAEF